MTARNTIANDNNKISNSSGGQNVYGAEAQTSLRYTNQQVVDTDMQRLQSPVFNIHIHVPPYQGDGMKMYLPRIQPVIHLHFDEIAKKLRINNEQDHNAMYSEFQNILSMISPKFGDVQFHFDNNACKTVNIKTEAQRRELYSSPNYFNDANVNLGTITQQPETRFLDNFELSDQSGSSSTYADYNTNHPNYVSENNSYSEEALKRKFKLKEAVVVLEDVCKTKYYKDILAISYMRDEAELNDNDFGGTSNEMTNSGRQENNGGQENSEGQENNGAENNEHFNLCIKKERESCSPEHVSASRMNGTSEISNFHPLYFPHQEQREAPSLPSKDTERIGNKSTSAVTVGSEKTLTSLAEGCNFAEILSRFKIKYCNKFTEDQSLQELKGIHQTESSSKTSSPPKKTKASDKESRRTRSLSTMEEYIPLQASGPTKFAVVALNKVNPYKTHGARNFKKEMLFGNRINRFSSRDHLRVYQLKQKAVKSQSK